MQNRHAGYNFGMKRRIALVIERADASLGGAERSVFELAGALGAAGLEVDILAAKGEPKSKNILTLCQDRPGKRACYFSFANALRGYLSKNHYDIVHSVLPFEFADVYQPRGGTYIESIFRNAASYQNRFVEDYKKLTAFINLRRTMLQWAERRLCKKQDGPIIAALSKYVVEQFKRHYAVKDERFVVIDNGVKTDKRIDREEADKLREQIARQLGLKEVGNAIFFLFAANNFRLKGLSVLIKAMQLAVQQRICEDAHLIVAGRDRANKYRQIAKSFGIDKKIVFLGPLGRIQDALSIIDVAVLPTFYDPSSRFILEAIAAGKPVITTRFNGATDLFVNGRHGKVIDRPEDSQSLAEAIRYFSDRKNIQKASEAITADNLKEKVSIDRVAREFVFLYESILQRKDAKQ